MNCDDRIPQLHALLDGELPPAEATALTAHIASCPDCAELLAELASFREALTRAVPKEPATADFHARVSAALRSAAPAGELSASRPRFAWDHLVSLAAGAAIAAMLTITLLPSARQTSEFAAVRDATLRRTAGGLQPQAAPAVPGFRLVAARRDIIAGHDSRVLSYAKTNQTVTLCIWPAGGEPAHGLRQATYRDTTITYWNDGSNEFWAATTKPAVLESFVAGIRLGPATQ